MQLVMGGINGNYLRNFTLNAANQTHEVLAGVAYSTDSSLLFDWCWENEIPLRFYGRLDESVAVIPSVLSNFLQKKSERFKCSLVQHHHAKVIWWRGYGLYIGSANLTQSAWYKNIEAGCFFSEAEITDDIATDILTLFKTLEENSTPLTEELLEVMQKRSKQLSGSKIEADTFWNSPCLSSWSGLNQINKTKATDQKRQIFLDEWHSTLQQIRDIGEVVSLPANQPNWINAGTPSGTQADQFLHAHYYQRTFDGGKTKYLDHFERNKNDPSVALEEAIEWWRNLTEAPQSEDKTLNEIAPMLETKLDSNALTQMTYEDFREVCENVHAIRGYARRVANKAVGLKGDGTKYDIPEKVAALSERIWNDKSAGDYTVQQLLTFVLYGGTSAQLPERLWSAVHETKWKIDGLGISALGELVGWALPHQFPPRNGRTSKSLKSLGYNVDVHVGH